MVVGMSVFITPLTELVPRYAKWQPALLSFALMSLSIAFSAISSPLTNTLNAIGKISDTLKLMVMWTLLTWVLTPIAIWKFGFNGVAIAGFVIAFSSVMPIIYVKKYVQIKVIDSIYRQLIAAIGMGVVSMLGFSFWSRSWLWFTTGTLISMGTYTVILLLVGWTKLKTEVVSLLKR
jgi:O-antigen/teichoic acid export membrane protein